MEFSLEPFEFPTQVDKVVHQGEILDFNVELNNVGLVKPILYDKDKKPNHLTLVDENDLIYQIRCKLINYEEISRNQTGIYKFNCKVKSTNLTVGEIRVIGYTYNLRGEVIPIRQLHKVLEAL